MILFAGRAMCFALLVTLIVRSTPASFPGSFLHAPAVPADSAARHCLSLGDELYASDVPVIGSCAATGTRTVGTVNGERWFAAEYERARLIATNDTAVEMELVLFKQRNAATGLEPVWHYRYEPEYLRSVTPELRSLDAHSLLFAVDECVNGTGGCSQSFAMLSNGAARPLALRFLDSLAHRFPGALQHGFHVDLATLRATAPLYSQGDANCCPSRQAVMQLRLRSGALEIGSLAVRPIREK
jgi:hypothetical protein